MNGTTIVAVVSVLSAALLTPLVAGYLSERRSERSIRRRDSLDVREALDEAGAEQRRLWWTFQRINASWATGESISTPETQKLYADYLNTREAVSISQTKLAIRLGRKHPVSIACTDVNDFANDLGNYLEGYREDAPYDEGRYQALYKSHSTVRANFLDAAEAAYNAD